MELNKSALYKELQSFFSSSSVIIVGSGLSCAEGLPGMRTLANELINKIPELIDTEDISCWEQIRGELIDRNGKIRNNANLEAALLKYPATINIEKGIKNITENLIKAKESEVISSVISNEKKLKFSKFINQFPLSESGLPIITTNYDRLLEVACEINNIPVDSMFYGKNISKFNEQKSKDSFCERVESSGRGAKGSRKVYTKKVLVLKPHGCLNWYMFENEPISTTLNLPLERLIITPGTHKFLKGYNIPFDQHVAKSNSCIDEAGNFVIIGYGFNDQHLETHLIQRIKANIPTLIITMELSENAKRIIEGLQNVIAITSHCEGGSEIRFRGKEYTLADKVLWDIEKFIEEVFE